MFLTVKANEINEMKKKIIRLHRIPRACMWGTIFIGCLLACLLLGNMPLTKEELLFETGKSKAVTLQEPLKIPVCDLSLLPYQEKLVYKGNFLGIPIGEFIVMNNGKMMLNGQEAYCFELTINRPPFFSGIFKTKSRYVSYVSTQEFVVLRHEEYIQEGTVLESVVDFDYKNLTATYKNFIDEQENTVQIPDKLLDILGGGFYLRTMTLELGDTAEINIYADQKIYNCTGVLYSKTQVNVPRYGKQNAYCFKPYLFLDGRQIKKNSAEVFLSTIIPAKTLRATIKMPLGSVHLVLTEGYEAL